MKYPDRLKYKVDSKGYTLMYRGRSIGGSGLLERSKSKTSWEAAKRAFQEQEKLAQEHVARILAGGATNREIEDIRLVDRMCKT